MGGLRGGASQGSGIRPPGGDRIHSCANLRVLQWGSPFEPCARRFIQYDRKIVFREAREALRQVVDRVVLGWQRTVTARVLHFETVIDEYFLASLQFAAQGFAVF